jgi:hypothetical protein
VSTEIRFEYPYKAIQSVRSLAAALQVSEKFLLEIAGCASDLYIGPIPQKKRDGGVRYVYDTKPRLKLLLKRINNIFFKKVKFPSFLKGSLKNQTPIKNAGEHLGCKTLIQEDIKSFYDNINREHVKLIWLNLFKFSEEVSDVLTSLVTRNGIVQQGSPTSSYIANLVFFKHEINLKNQLEDLGIKYTRYIDDVTLSSKEVLDKKIKDFACNKIIGMIKGYGFTPHPVKRSITPNKRHKLGKVTGLNVARKVKPSVPKAERAKIRAHMHSLATMDLSKVELKDAIKQASRLSGRIALLKSLHPAEHSRLRKKLMEFLERIAMQMPKSFVTVSTVQKDQGLFLDLEISPF